MARGVLSLSTLILARLSPRAPHGALLAAATAFALPLTHPRTGREEKCRSRNGRAPTRMSYLLSPLPRHDRPRSFHFRSLRRSTTPRTAPRSHNGTLLTQCRSLSGSTAYCCLGMRSARALHWPAARTREQCIQIARAAEPLQQHPPPSREPTSLSLLFLTRPSCQWCNKLQG